MLMAFRQTPLLLWCVLLTCAWITFLHCLSSLVFPSLPLDGKNRPARTGAHNAALAGNCHIFCHSLVTGGCRLLYPTLSKLQLQSSVSCLQGFCAQLSGFSAVFSLSQRAGRVSMAWVRCQLHLPAAKGSALVTSGVEFRCSLSCPSSVFCFTARVQLYHGFKKCPIVTEQLYPSLNSLPLLGGWRRQLKFREFIPSERISPRISLQMDSECRVAPSLEGTLPKCISVPCRQLPVPMHKIKLEMSLLCSQVH